MIKMKIIVFCIFAEIITVLSFNIYNSYNPYKRWIFQRRIPLYSYKINWVGTGNGNINGQSKNNLVLITRNSTGLDDTNNLDYKTSQIQNTDLNLDGKIIELPNVDKTLEEDIDTDVIKQSNLENKSSYPDIEPLSGLERQNYFKLSQTPYIPNYLTYFYGNNRNLPVNYYVNNIKKGGYSYGLYKNNGLNLTDVITTGKGSQDINTGLHYAYNSYLDKENNKIEDLVKSEVNLKDETKESPVSVTLEESQEDNYDKTKTDNVTVETKEVKKHNVSEVEENEALKKIPCLDSLVPLISNGIKMTNNVEIARNNVLDTRLGDFYRNQVVPFQNRGVCIHKCLTICN